MCVFCENDMPEYLPTTDQNAILFVDKNNKILDYTTTVEEYIYEASVNIKYCPMCGKKL